MVEQAGDIASNGHLRVEGVVQVRFEFRGRDIHSSRSRRNLNRFRHSTRLKRDWNRQGSVREHFNLFHLHCFEACLLGLQRVIAGRQQVEHKATLRVGRRCPIAGRTGKRDLRFWHDGTCRVRDYSTEVALNGRLLGEQTNTEKQN